jgi:hypothetical protein
LQIDTEDVILIIYYERVLNISIFDD